MSEVGLGIGRYGAVLGGIEQEALGWFNEAGTRYLTAEERAERAERLAERLRELGEDPTSFERYDGRTPII